MFISQRRSYKSLLLASIGLAALAIANAAAAQGMPEKARQPTSIPSQDLGIALNQLASSSDVAIVFNADLVRGKRSKPVQEVASVDAALEALLKGSGLVYAKTPSGAYVLNQVAQAAQSAQRAPLPSDEAASPGETPKLEEIIVTAQRRAEPISQTPVAVTAITGEMIERSAVSSISALENLTPSLTLNQGGQAATGGFRIRGIGTETFSAGVEPAVATIVDGVLIGRTTNVTSLQLVDIERIEVLRGPQGTLFGKNASSGVVNIVTRGPTDTFESGFSATMAEQREYNVNGYVSGPISQGLSFRLTAFANTHDGHVKNTVPDASPLWAPLLAAQPNLLKGIKLYKGDDFYNLRALGIRGKLRYETDTLASLLTVDFASSDSDCCARTFIDFYQSGTGLNRRIFGAAIGRESDETTVDAPLKGRDESSSAALDNTLQLGGGYELASITGIRKQLNESIEDQDYGSGPELGLPAFFDKAEFDFRRSWTTQFSQEFRVNSPQRTQEPSEISFDYVLGAYYFHQNDDFGPGNERIQIVNNSPPIAGCSTAVCRRDFVYQVKLTSENSALFGQFNIRLGDQWTVFYGGRYVHDKIKYDWNSRDDQFAPFRQGTFARKEAGSANNYSQRIGVDFRPDDTSFFYASFSEGYKGPGFRTFERIGSEEFLRPERAKAYELGTRLRFPNAGTYAGLTLYRQDYRDLVVSGFDQTLRITRNFNAAKARSQGFELDLTSRPVEPLSITGGIAYSDNKYVNFPGTSCYPFQTAAEGCVLDPTAGRVLQSLAQAPLQRAPEFKATLGMQYDLPELSNGVQPFFGVNYRRFSEQQYGGNNDPKTIQPGYGIMDLSVGLRAFDGNFEARLFAKNALDQFYAVNIFSTDNWLNQRIPRDYRRYFGLTLSAKY
jgi:iron complex outermembrane recepter protein